jgi:O-methyltransferase domain/Dimerisation domain
MVDGNEPQDAPPLEVARRLIMGFRTTQLVHVAAKLGIADLLKDGPQEASAMATAVGAHPRALYRLLRALTSLGIFAETIDGRFQLTPLAHTLRSDIPGSLRDLALLYGDEWVWTAYGRTLYSVTSGLPAFDLVHGQTLFEYLHLHPQAASTFDRGMTAYSEQEAAAVLGAYDFSDVSNVVDVGGGQGALLAAILSAHPHTCGVLFDQSGVLDRARNVLARAGVAGRCAVRPGDFFEAVPDGGDVYVLKSILHNWDDGRSIAILRNCRAVMRRGSKLLIIERVVPEGNEPSEAKLFDVNMLVVLGGLERTRREYNGILEDAGLGLTRVIPTKAPVSILEAVPRSV